MSQQHRVTDGIGCFKATFDNVWLLGLQKQNWQA